MPTPPQHPDLGRQLKDRLLALSPRAFELFSGDLLTYIGLKNIAVTRYVGDGGVDAHGDLVSESGLVCVPTGVQVKRHRANVQRTDIDRFIGALAGQYRHGIFITTAGYAQQARAKAQTSPLLRVDTIGGDDLVALMRRHRLGLREAAAAPLLDEGYFLGFEAQAGQRTIRDQPAPYAASAGAPVAAADDLISLRALSYDLRMDMYTVRDWVERGRLLPDQTASAGRFTSYFFRRDRVAQIRHDLVGAERPASGAAWRQAFLDFARSRSLTRSYKPVLLRALLDLVDRSGQVRLDDLAEAFHAFYLQRQRDGLPAELGATLMADPAAATRAAVRRLIIRNPLERFIIQGFLEHDAAADVVRFAPQLWGELRAYELLDLRQSADDQLRFYYQRGELP